MIKIYAQGESLKASQGRGLGDKLHQAAIFMFMRVFLAGGDRRQRMRSAPELAVMANGMKEIIFWGYLATRIRVPECWGQQHDRQSSNRKQVFRAGGS
jgi:hypothetical protein